MQGVHSAASFLVFSLGANHRRPFSCAGRVPDAKRGTPCLKRMGGASRMVFSLQKSTGKADIRCGVLSDENTWSNDHGTKTQGTESGNVFRTAGSPDAGTSKFVGDDPARGCRRAGNPANDLFQLGEWGQRFCIRLGTDAFGGVSPRIRSGIISRKIIFNMDRVIDNNLTHATITSVNSTGGVKTNFTPVRSGRC